MPERIFIPARRCGKTASTCQGCGRPWNRLFDAFTNGLGWRKLCGRCADPQPEHAAPRAYTGPYPTRSKPVLTLIEGGAQ